MLLVAVCNETTSCKLHSVVMDMMSWALYVDRV